MQKRNTKIQKIQHNINKECVKSLTHSLKYILYVDDHYSDTALQEQHAKAQSQAEGILYSFHHTHLIAAVYYYYTVWQKTAEKWQEQSRELTSQNHEQSVTMDKLKS